MIKNINGENDYARPKAQLRFPEAGARFVVNEVGRKSPTKNSRHVSLESLNFRKPSSNRLLGSLSARDLSRLQPYLKSVSLIVGENIYQPHDRIRDVYFPESAVISNLQMLEDGRTVEIGMTGKEGVTGFSSVFNVEPPVSWTEVVVAGNALKLSARILEQEFANSPALQMSLLGYVNSYIEQISQRVVCSNFHRIEERFCSWLLMLYNRSGAGKFTLTQEQIARFLGVHRPSVSLIAGELREREIIDYRRGKIIILNLRKLEQSTCSCF